MFTFPVGFFNLIVSGGGGGTTDPFAANVVLFLKGDGTNGSTNIVDSSPSPKTITVNGNAQISTAQSKYGGSSLLFDGSGDYLSIPATGDMLFSSQNFTWEAWIYPTTLSASYRITLMGNARASAGGDYGMYLQVKKNATNQTMFSAWGNENGSIGSTLNLNQWNHIACTRVGTTVEIFVNGIKGTTGSCATSITSHTEFLIGRVFNNSGYSDDYTGYIDSLRLTAAIRYTANFNPETDTYLDLDIPAPTLTINRCLATNGGTVTASSTFNSNFPASSTINGDRKGLNWANGGGWNNAGSLPAWLEVAFSTSYSITKINVITLQDNYNSPVEPTTATTFSSFGVTSYSIEYWNGSAWIVIDSTTGNNKVYKEFTFSAVTTTKIRVYITASVDGVARLVEVEAY